MKLCRFTILCIGVFLSVPAYSAMYQTSAFRTAPDEVRPWGGDGVGVVAAMGSSEYFAVAAKFEGADKAAARLTFRAGSPEFKFAPVSVEKADKGKLSVHTFRIDIPKDVAAAVYNGTLELGSESIPVTLRVLPFSLPAPVTHYDISKPFTYYNSVEEVPDSRVGDPFADFTNMPPEVVRCLAPFSSDADLVLRWHITKRELVDYRSPPYLSDISAEGSAEFLRRMRGFALWRSDFDGGVIEDWGSSPLHAAALFAARQDVAYASLLMIFSERCRASSDLLTRLEGRRAAQFVYNTKPMAEDLDRLRLEIIASILKLQDMIETRGVR